jgi:DNA anti-recombination protein RmuC
MPRKKGLGQQVTKALTIMDELKGCLSNFIQSPLKIGLGSAADEDLTKKIDEALEKAVALKHQVENLQGAVNAIKTDVDSRFASDRVGTVIQKFLTRSQGTEQ